MMKSSKSSRQILNYKEICDTFKPIIEPNLLKTSTFWSSCPKTLQSIILNLTSILYLSHIQVSEYAVN